MNVVFIVPTGLGAAIGGHAGDATPAARLIGSVCDNIILHPNVVNASDINEMPANALYVMGTSIDDLLRGYIGLEPVRQNRVAVAVNRPVPNEIVNIVSAARATLGMDAFIAELPTPLKMTAFFDEAGAATGTITGAHEAAEFLQTCGEDFDALAVLSAIEVSREVALTYVQKEGVNPWGGVEAKLTRALTDALKVPCAHGPSGHTLDDYDEIVDPRMAAEMVSQTYAFCVLKGLHRAPEITDGRRGITVDDIDAMVAPHGSFGIPEQACLDHGIPIIKVRENSVMVDNPAVFPHIMAENYLEAAGVVVAMREGIALETLRRPLARTKVVSSSIPARDG